MLERRGARRRTREQNRTTERDEVSRIQGFHPAGVPGAGRRHTRPTSTANGGERLDCPRQATERRDGDGY